MFDNVSELPIFTTCLYETQVEFDNHSLEELIRSLPEQNYKRSSSGWQSNFFVNEYDNDLTKNLLGGIIRPLCEGIANKVWAMMISEFSFEYWYNINSTGDYNTQHTHPESIVSGVYYVTVPKDSGNIVFMRSQAEFDALSRIVTEKVSPVIDCSHYRIPAEGKMVLFPGYVPHYVEQNKSTDDRISISFNLMRK